MVDQMLKRAPIARIKADTPFCTRTVEAIYTKDCLTGFLEMFWEPGSQMTHIQYGNTGSHNYQRMIVAATILRALASKHGNLKPLNVYEMMSRMAVDKEELIRVQEEYSTLQKLKRGKRNRNKKAWSYLARMHHS